MASKFHIPLPDQDQRKHILDLTLKSEVLGPDFNLNKLSILTEGFSGSDLKEVARSSAVACLADLQLSRDHPLSHAGSESSLASIAGAPPPRGWLSSLIPFNSRRGLEDEEGLDAENTNGAVTSRNMSLRAITMRDFESSVSKLRESRSHCSTGMSQRVELD